MGSYRNYNQYNTSSAYDFERFMPKTKEQKKAKIVKISDAPAANKANKKAKQSKAHAASFARVKTVGVAAAIVAMLCAMIYLRVEVTDANRELSSVQSEAELLKSEENRLQMELENKISIANIEAEAQSLGMQKADKSQVNYIRVNEPADTATAEAGEN